MCEPPHHIKWLIFPQMGVKNMTICDYVNETCKKITYFGGNGSDVFNSNVSDAMLKCFQIMVAYASAKGMKEIPTPFAVVGKNNDGVIEDTTNFASIKFSSEYNLDTTVLTQVIHNLGLADYINIESFSTCTNIEVYMPVMVNNI